MIPLISRPLRRSWAGDAALPFISIMFSLKARHEVFSRFQVAAKRLPVVFLLFLSLSNHNLSQQKGDQSQIFSCPARPDLG